MKRMKHDAMSVFKAGSKADGAVSGYAIEGVEAVGGVGAAEAATVGLGAVGSGIAIEKASKFVFGKGPFGALSKKADDLKSSLFSPTGGGNKPPYKSQYSEGYKPDYKSSHNNPFMSSYSVDSLPNSSKTIKAGAEAAAKQGLRMTPGLGAVAGAVFMGQELMAGNFQRAGLEFVSAVADLAPVVGTPIGLAADAALMSGVGLPNQPQQAPVFPSANASPAPAHLQGFASQPMGANTMQAMDIANTGTVSTQTSTVNIHAESQNAQVRMDSQAQHKAQMETQSKADRGTENIVEAIRGEKDAKDEAIKRAEEKL